MVTLAAEKDIQPYSDHLCSLYFKGLGQAFVSRDLVNSASWRQYCGWRRWHFWIGSSMGPDMLAAKLTAVFLELQILLAHPDLTSLTACFLWSFQRFWDPISCFRSLSTCNTLNSLYSFYWSLTDRGTFVKPTQIDYLLWQREYKKKTKNQFLSTVLMQTSR